MADLINLIKQLRERTGAGIMDCKKALLANDQDLEKSVVWLREKGIAKQEKKASRTASEGIAWTKVSGNKGVIIEINCETDFVANSDPFRALVTETIDAILASETEPADKEACMALPSKDGRTLKDVYLDASIKLGEKLDFRRFAIVYKNDDEFFAPYIHMKGKIATLVITKGGDQEIANGLALNITSDNPAYISEADIPSEIIAKETEIETEASKNDPSFAKKPEAIQAKIIEGRVKKNLGSAVLTNQQYILDETKTVGEILKQHSASIVSFIRYAVGEGIEKKVNDFASEVEAQMKK